MSKEYKEYIIGKTVVNGIVQEIWNREESHSLGRDNGRNEHLWLKQTYEDIEGTDWVPWIDIATNRPCYEVKIAQGNRTKYKWGETRINGTCQVDILCNQKKVYEFRCMDIEYGLANAQVLLAKMGEHPFDFADPESMVGRKIWYHRQAAVVDYLILQQGCIMIRKEDGTGFDLSQPWRDDDDIEDPWDNQNKVKDDIFSEQIWWFRD